MVRQRSRPIGSPADHSALAEAHRGDLGVSSGASVKSIQRMLGHASAAMTLDVYADLFDDDLDAVGVALDHAATSSSVGFLWVKPTKARDA